MDFVMFTIKRRRLCCKRQKRGFHVSFIEINQSLLSMTVTVTQ